MARKTSVLCCLLLVSGCGGGSRGTGAGGMLRDYESSFIGESGGREGTSLFEDNDDEEDESRSEPCPLNTSRDIRECEEQSELLQDCADALGYLDQEGEKDGCERAKELSRYFLENVKKDSGAAQERAECRKILMLCRGYRP